MVLPTMNSVSCNNDCHGKVCPRYSCGTNAMEGNNYFLNRFKEEIHAWCCKSDVIFLF